MIKMEKTQVLKCPVEKAFAYITDMNNLTQWETNMSDVEILTSGEFGIGSKFSGKAKAMGMRMKWIAEVVEWEPNRKYTENIASGGSTINARLLFEPAEEGTKLTIVREMNMAGPLRLLTPFLKNSVSKQSDESFNNLKNILETRE